MYQMPLAQHENPEVSENWGAVDLVGYNSSHYPVLIELKAPTSKESPLLAVMEVAAYGVAVLKIWNSDASNLSEEWHQARKMPEPTEKPEEELKELNLVVAAPQPYWDNWSDKLAECRTEINRLTGKLKESGFPLHFVSLSPVSLNRQGEKLPPF